MNSRLMSRATLAVGLLALVVTLTLTAEAVNNAYMKGVVSRGGRPVRSAWVVVTQNNIEKGRSLTGDDGKYYIGELGAGAHEIAVWQGERKVYAGQVRLPDNTLFNIQLDGR